MQIYCIYFIIVTIFTFYTKPGIGKKLLFKRNSISRNDEDWDDGAESFGRGTSVKRQQPFDDNRRVNKPIEFEDARDDQMDPYNDKRNKKRSPFGIVYSGGQPIGVIEPLYQSYQLKNFDDPMMPVHNYKKRDLLNELSPGDVMLESNPYQNNANLHGGKYAAVLASFKIDNRLKSDAYNNDDAVSIEKRREKNRITKRDPPLQPNETPAKDLSKPSNFVAKVKRDTVDLANIERNIINVMDDLGLAESASKDIQKRNIDATFESDLEKRDYDEDEDLEMGANKISMIKENLERSKKDNIGPNVVVDTSPPQELKKAVKNKRSHILNYQHEGEEYIRNKRYESPNSGTIVKDLENSGELTVSGNKSPLVSVNSEQNNSDNKRGINQQTAVNNTTDIKKRNNDYNDYEKMLEKNIQNKIIAIKANVKREIYNLNENERRKRNANLTDIKVNIKRDMNRLNKIIASKEMDADCAKKDKRAINPQTQVRECRNASLGEDESADELNFRGRMSREINDDDKYTDDELDLPFKRESKNADDDDVDVNVEQDNPSKLIYNADIMKRSDLMNNSQNGNSGNVPLQPQQMQVQPQQLPPQPPPPSPQPQQQPQPPLNVAADQGSFNNGYNGGMQPSMVANQTQFNGGAGNQQGNGELAQKQQYHLAQDGSISYRQANTTANKPLRRQSLMSDYDPDGLEDKVDELRSTDDEDGTLKFGSDTDNTDDEEDADNDKNLVRQERFLQNITEEELRNLENENPSLEQRRRREIVDLQYDYNNNEDDYNGDDVLAIPKRSKRAHYNAYGEDLLYGDEEEEVVNPRVYRKRNLDYEVDNRNNYYSNDKRQRRNNNDPNYVENTDEDSFDSAPDYDIVEDYRRRKRQAMIKTDASHAEDGQYNKNVNYNDRNGRKKRLGGNKLNRKSAKDINMEALSHSELFGGLPQTFQGELSRFKRVKRSSDY